MFGRDRGAYDLLGHHLPKVELDRLIYRRRAELDPIEAHSFDFLDNASYGGATYYKTDAAMHTLEGLIGPERMEAALRHYYELWRFRHPRCGDFVSAFDEGAKEDLAWFWDPALHTTQVLDYRLLSIDVEPERPPAGLFDVDGGARVEVAPQRASGDGMYTSEVVVHRRGDFLFPVELNVAFDDGATARERWDGGRTDGSRWRRFTYVGKHKVVSAQIDPHDQVALDVSRWNNGLLVERDGRARRRVTGWWAMLVSTALSLVGW
jgi:hypothetical protein